MKDSRKVLLIITAFPLLTFFLMSIRSEDMGNLAIRTLAFILIFYLLSGIILLFTGYRKWGWVLLLSIAITLFTGFLVWAIIFSVVLSGIDN
jgi:hypothetical protein